MAKKVKKTYDVWANVKMIVTAKVEADTLEQALEKSKALNANDFIYHAPGEVIDTEFEITGILK